MKAIAIIGSGLMGLRLADYFASRYLDVIVVTRGDVNDKVRSFKAILAKRKEKSGIESYEEVGRRVRITSEWESIIESEVILESVVESKEVKGAVFKRIMAICPFSEKLIATNTSSLSIKAMRDEFELPYLVGLHFFNPPIKMQLVEYAIAGKAGPRQIELLTELFAKCEDKTFIEAPVIPGYIVNRLLFAYLNTCLKFGLENDVEIGKIDEAMRLGANMPMGPFELCDYIGIDTTVEILKTFFEETKDPVYQPTSVLSDILAKGHLGKKNGQGFYKYREKA